jgi:micrococcal nuclease
VSFKDTLFAFGRRLPVCIYCGYLITATAPCVALPPASLQSSATAPCVALPPASLQSSAFGATDCPARQTSERVEVAYVYDGDTVRLADGRRLRFIGINTPEIGHHGAENQPFAAAARTFLNDLLDANNRILELQPGREERDHYGRLLAHAFLQNDSNVAVRVLDAGLATTLVVPPNTWSVDCYQQHENDARAAHRGLWSLSDYQPRDSLTLQRDTTGFRLVRGRVTTLRHTRYGVRVELAGMLALHLSSRDLANFPPGYFDALAGQRVEVRGWIKRTGDGLKINVRHPSALRRLAAESLTRPP